MLGTITLISEDFFINLSHECDTKHCVAYWPLKFTSDTESPSTTPYLQPNKLSAFTSGDSKTSRYRIRTSITGSITGSIAGSTSNRTLRAQAKAAQEQAAAADIGRRMAVLNAGKAKMDGSIALLRNEVASCHPRRLTRPSQVARALPHPAPLGARARCGVSGADRGGAEIGSGARRTAWLRDAPGEGSALVRGERRGVVTGS